MYLGNIAGLIIVLTCVPLFAAILRVPFSVIAPIIMVICAIGAYTVHNAMLDIWIMLLFGVARLRVQEACSIRSRRWCWRIVLGDRAEASFRQAMLMSQGDMSIFFSNWLVGGITALALLLLFWPLISWRDRRGALRRLRARRSFCLRRRERLGREVEVGRELLLRHAVGELGVLALEALTARPGASSRCSVIVCAMTSLMSFIISSSKRS